jgi:hypothetical protein
MLMTTELLEPPEIGANAQQTPLYPARVKLSATLADFERAEAELEDYKGRAARAAADEDRALEDQALTEKEVAERITKSQNERNVYNARQMRIERRVRALELELPGAINGCIGELRQLVNLELQRRNEIIAARVLEAIEAVSAGPFRQMALEKLLGFSGPVQRVAILMPEPYLYSARDERLDHVARAILENFERLVPQIGKEI